MLLIGPLHHSVKPKLEENADLSYLEYGMMEVQKVKYKDAFTKRPNSATILDRMMKTTQDEEEKIRASYAVSTAWILPEVFVQLILNDSIFILEFILRVYQFGREGKTGDLIVDNDYYHSTILEDLALLENQLPYFYLNKLLDPIIQEFCNGQTLAQVIFKLFSVNDLIKGEKTFYHFTDMYRCIYEESLGESTKLNDSTREIVDMKSAEQLSTVGVTFEKMERDDYSLKVSFEEGCFKMSSFPSDEASNVILRNVIAYEQCHEIKNAFATNYINFLNFLITTDEDVKILTSEGLLTNGVGRPSMVLKMVNSLSKGVLLSKKTQYHGIVNKVNTHYRSRRIKMWAKLRKVYFSDPLTTTATLAAISLLLLTLAGTVASIIQAIGGSKAETQKP